MTTVLGITHAEFLKGSPLASQPIFVKAHLLRLLNRQDRRDIFAEVEKTAGIRN